MKPVKVGIIGCGNISHEYFRALNFFEMTEIAACSDLQPARAQEKFEQFEVGRVCTTEELLADPEIELVVNLTTPPFHTEIAMTVLDAGKHYYGEKPLSAVLSEGKAILDKANEKGLLVGCAPDTFLGGGLQTTRKLIDDGYIGRPLSCIGFLQVPGHETWHPEPDFYYKPGGGPVLDMCPYYLTAMINLLGPITRVAASMSRGFDERRVLLGERRGERIAVEVDTHAAGVLDFASGVVGTMVSSFDTCHATTPFLEIYGTEGAITVPNPVAFCGPVRLRRADANEWTNMNLTHGHTETLRGMGAVDLAYAIRTGRPHRATGAQAYHVLEVMHAFFSSHELSTYQAISSQYTRPAALPTGLWPGTLDE